MKFIPIKTRAFLPPKDDIYDLLDSHLPRLREGDILFITSKILGIHEGRCIKIKTNNLSEKDKLALAEVARYIPRSESPHEYSMLTINQNTLISTAGIDRSNGNGYYILWPKHTLKLLNDIRKYLKKKYRIKNLGLIALDSQSIPLRYGTVGITIGTAGFYPISDERGKKDVFGYKLRVTKINIADSLASFANVLMGEANERTPLLIARGLKFIKFTDKPHSKDLLVPEKYDMFYPLLKYMKKKR